MLAELTPELGQVQARSHAWVCNMCLGPTNVDFECCFACAKILKNGAPNAFADAVIPATVATNPGLWFNRLSTYKVSYPSYRAHVAALAWSFIELHEERLAAMAGGAIGVVTPVPSKRGRSYMEQPLRQALSAVRPIRDRMADTLQFVPAPDINWRRDYYPQCFDGGPDSVAGQHVLLIEDSWVTGATALAAAGALIGLGARGVAILALARVIDVSFWQGREHPYLERVSADSASREPFDITRWTR